MNNRNPNRENQSSLNNQVKANKNLIKQKQHRYPRRRTSVWQMLLVTITILFLGISALPNFYINDKAAMPQWLESLDKEPIKLGLDLNGGVLLVLNVDLDHPVKEKISFIQSSIKKQARELKLRDLKIDTTDLNGIILNSGNSNGISSDSVEKISSYINKNFPELVLNKLGKEQVRLEISESELLKLKNEVMLQVLSTMRNRIESLGITESVVQRQGEKRIRIELPGVKNSEEARKVIGSTATLDFYQLTQRSSKYFVDEQQNKIFVKSHPIFTGDNVKNAVAGRDEMGIPQVSLYLDAAGGEKVLKHSSGNIGTQMVTVYSEFVSQNNNKAEKSASEKKSKVISVATIQSVLGDRFSITNLSSPRQAQELALQIRAGALSAPVTIVKEQSIDATLGESNISNGLKALGLGLGITLSFMALWYRKLGLVANCALVVNLVCLIGVMSLLPGAVLTLPGIAGLVLTVGMAVDANVIIFERIKEELRKNKPKLLAVEQGYQNALSSIVDANITTLVTAIILYSIGFGPVKGFAITLGLGVLTSLFSGVYLSKILCNWWFVSQEKTNRELTAIEGKSQ